MPFIIKKHHKKQNNFTRSGSFGRFLVDLHNNPLKNTAMQRGGQGEGCISEMMQLHERVHFGAVLSRLQSASRLSQTVEGLQTEHAGRGGEMSEKTGSCGVCGC